MTGQVVVGNDDLHSPGPGVGHLFMGGDSGIHRDDQADALVRKTVDGSLRKAVAFVYPVGQVRRNRYAPRGEPLGDNRRPGNAVYVEVAKYAHRFPVIDRPVQPPERGRHAGERRRAVGQGVGRFEKSA